MSYDTPNGEPMLSPSLEALLSIPNQKLSGAKSELQQGTVGVCSSYKGGAANHSIIVHYETCKYAYTCACLVSEASTNKKYEEKMHIKARKTIFLTLLQ